MPIPSSGALGSQQGWGSQPRSPVGTMQGHPASMPVGRVGSTHALDHTFAQSMPPQMHWTAGPQGGSASPRSLSPAGTMSGLQPGATSMQTSGGFLPAAPRTSAGAVQSATGTMFMGGPPASYQAAPSQLPQMPTAFAQSQPRAQPGFGTLGTMGSVASLGVSPVQSTVSPMTPVPTPPHSGQLVAGPGGVPVPQSAPPQAHGADVARQSSSGGLKLFNGPGSWGPPAEDGSGLSRKSVRSVVLLSILTFVCVCALPVLCAYQLLEDKHYRFWMGTDYPYKLLAIACGSLALLVGTSYSLFHWAPASDLNEWTMAHVAAVFSALTGVALVLVSLTGSANLAVTAGRLAHGCQNTMAESMLLIDYTQVLYNIRNHPDCEGKRSVEECDGWSSNKYTEYARHLENDLKCGPLCADTPEFPFPVTALMQETAPALIQESAASATSQLDAHEPEAPRRRASAPARGLLQVDGAAVISHKAGLNRTAGRDDKYFRVGDEVRLSGDKQMVLEAFAETHYVWHPEIEGMLGNTYQIVEVPQPGIVGLPAPVGVQPNQNGVWYFPVARPVKVKELAKPMDDISMANLFSRGETRMSCLPLVSTRLKVLSWSFSDLAFWEGVGLIFCSILALGLTALSSLCGGRKG